MNTELQPKSLQSLLVKGLRSNVKQYSMFIALILIGLIFTFLTNGIFITPRNLSTLFVQTSYIAILAVGMVLVIVAGHIDLSVGSIAGLTGGIAAILQVNYEFGTIPAIFVTLLAGIAIGFFQGYWIAYRKVPAFIVTLAGMLIFRGLLVALTGGQTIAPMEASFKAIGQDYIPQLFLIGTVGKDVPFHDTSLGLAFLSVIGYLIFEWRNRKSRIQYGFQTLSVPLQWLKMLLVSSLIMTFFSIMILYRGVPWSILLVMFLVLLFNFITKKTVFGRHVYAIGGNKEAARLSGINIQARTLGIFVIMGLLSAVSGIVFTARLDSAAASAGSLFELDTIAAAIIGGTSTMGGEGTIIGAIIGALVMASLNNGMGLMNVSADYQMIVKGLILLMAVWFDISSRNKKG